MLSRSGFLLPLLLGSVTWGQSIIDIAGPSTAMNAVYRSPGVLMTDPRGDHQTGISSADLVGGNEVVPFGWTGGSVF